MEYGRTNSLSTNPLVIKATILNSALRCAPLRDGSPWQQRTSSVVSGVLQVTSPLDTDVRRGRKSTPQLFRAIFRRPANARATWRNRLGFATIEGVSALNYNINSPLPAGSLLTATLNWFRHVNRVETATESSTAWIHSTSPRRWITWTSRCS